MKKFLSMVFSLSLLLTSVFSTGAKVRDVVKSDNLILRNFGLRVTDFDESLSELLDDMYDTMEKHGCVGLAASQIGREERVFIVKYDGEITEYVNPVITIRKGEQISIERSISQPGLWGEVVRSAYIKGTAFDENGEKFEFEADGDEARIICHEYDHMNGVLFTDIAKRIYTTKRIIAKIVVAAVALAILGGLVGYFASPYIIPLFV
ncbi:MAG: peptide deformylase [Oscillospiraceae bacterium]|jgi:peptide deformylase|nr:peptide deformylase [Oscillospiraceae bacterium]